jgi:hypothetical protein
VGKINILKMYERSVQVFDDFFFGDVFDNPHCFKLMVRLMRKTNIRTCNGGPSATCRAGDIGVHAL